MRNNKILNLIFSKSRVIAFVCIYAIMMTLLGSTYAWVTMSDTRVNRLMGETHLETKISERFDEPTDWQPGTDVTKEVRVFNSGTAPAFVRISMQEMLELYEMDIDGLNDNEGTANVVGTTPILTLNYNHTAYAFGSVDAVNGTRAATRTNAGADPLFGFIVLKFNKNVYIAGDAGIPIDGTPYWLYEDDFFYYSEMLPANQFTEPLLEKVGLAGNMPNLMKFADYEINVFHTNCYASEQGLGKWGLAATSAAGAMLGRYFV